MHTYLSDETMAFVNYIYVISFEDVKYLEEGDTCNIDSSWSILNPQLDKKQSVRVGTSVQHHGRCDTHTKDTGHALRLQNPLHYFSLQFFSQTIDSKP